MKIRSSLGPTFAGDAIAAYIAPEVGQVTYIHLVNEPLELGERYKCLVTRGRSGTLSEMDTIG